MPLHLAAGAHWPMGDMEGYEGDRMVATVQLLISTGAVDVNARCSVSGPTRVCWAACIRRHR